MYKKTIQKELSFAGEKLTRERHKIHPYPAMLHPLLVNYLIKKYAKDNDTIFDPFCGSGVTLLQSALNNHSSIGFDINPLSLLIAKVKSDKYDIKKLKEEFDDFKKSILKNKKTDIPEIKNIDYWYTKEVIEDLGKVRFILKNKKYKYNDFFIITFAYICRNQSLTRNGEFKRFRVKAEKIKDFPNNVFEKLFEHIENTIDIFSNSEKPKKSARPILSNSEQPISPEIKYDLVITSPPYGDSKTTVAYGEYSSFGSEWIDDLNVYGGNNYKVDNESIGKVGILNEEIKKCDLLTDILKKIENIDKKRAKEVLHFYNGYYNVIRNVIKNLNNNGRVCFVVGNRTVKGYQIPMDQITAFFLDSMGLKFEGIYVRDILNKVMPSQNSPTNVTGAKLKTMSNEYIVIFKKI
ncbi:DNA methyltransferase [Methanoculleus sp.]|uniref:DNA methyltransferase n=1 Tax=Methanoculleus sp. TaxID=90427 RepID=UPI0025E7EAA9|nr:DNA methyltransferase [Methanoculleus sp.]MCK9319573.1 site-specific DNA-methyltransferase [Methanoculleus sp.]